jgi:Holliday junction resolvasome RuvABC endonuclease subunit
MVNLSKFSNQPNTIMAIDASTNSLAFSIFRDHQLISYGKINFSGNSAYEKLIDACRKVLGLFQAYEDLSVEAIVIEHTVFINSPKTAADLALVQGSLLGAAGVSGVKQVRSVAPITWQNFIGNKKLTKEEQLSIRKQLPGKSDSWYKSYERQLRKEKTIHFIDVQYDVVIDDNDVSDAIAIGHYAINNWERLTK